MNELSAGLIAAAIHDLAAAVRELARAQYVDGDEQPLDPDQTMD